MKNYRGVITLCAATDSYLAAASGESVQPGVC